MQPMVTVQESPGNLPRGSRRPGSPVDSRSVSERASSGFSREYDGGGLECHSVERPASPAVWPVSWLPCLRRYRACWDNSWGARSQDP